MLLSLQLNKSSNERVQRALRGDIPFAIIWQGDNPLIVFHGSPSKEGMRSKAASLGKLKPSLLKRAEFVSCHGAYAPDWIQRKHISPIQGELTIEWMEIGDGSVAYFVHE